MRRQILTAVITALATAAVCLPASPAATRPGPSSSRPQSSFTFAVFEYEQPVMIREYICEALTIDVLGPQYVRRSENRTVISVAFRDQPETHVAIRVGPFPPATRPSC